ncbi:MAG: DUF5050 domain-containing protein, partial [Candidatus Delongbacteria bacterium]|nr:DUF5050 domain-containing protein [Candidatus Delongbacteria bacterium]
IYYISGTGDYPAVGPVYRIMNNGTDRQPFLPNVRTSTLLSDSSSLYFIPDTPERNLYRISLISPDSAAIVCDSSMAFINLRNQDLYFSSYHSGFIYRLNLSDRQITPILEQNCWNFYLAGHWLYYRLDMMNSDDSKLHRIPLP